MSPQVSWLFFKAVRAGLYCQSGSDRLADGPF